MDNKESEELQDPESWSDESEVRAPVKPQRAVVSVAFSREDFERVVEQAQRAGMKTSEFIRHAALEHVSEQRVPVQVFSVSGYVRTNIPFTRMEGPRIQVTTRTQEQDAFTTASY